MRRRVHYMRKLNRRDELNFEFSVFLHVSNTA